MKHNDWWRIEVDATGVVISYEKVEQAKDKEAAGVVAFNEYCRHRLRVRRAMLEAEGKCRCGAEREQDRFKRCNRCRERAQLHRARHLAKKRGENIAPLDRRSTLRERSESERADLRIEVLVEVERAWLDSKSSGDFTIWLSRQIIKGKKDTAA